MQFLCVLSRYEQRKYCNKKVGVYVVCCECVEIGLNYYPCLALLVVAVRSHSFPAMRGYWGHFWCAHLNDFTPK